jgi:hypothetical protein
MSFEIFGDAIIQGKIFKSTGIELAAGKITDYTTVLDTNTINIGNVIDHYDIYIKNTSNELVLYCYVILKTSTDHDVYTANTSLTSITALTAGKINIYLSAGDIILENKLGFTVNIAVVQKLV